MTKTKKQCDRMPKNEGLRIHFGRHGFVHPNYATHWEGVSIGQWSKEYQNKIAKIHHLAIMFPCVDYAMLQDVVEGRRLLKVEADDNSDDEDAFYGIRISSVISEEE